MKRKQREIENRADAFMTIYNKELKPSREQSCITVQRIRFNPLFDKENRKILGYTVDWVAGIPLTALSEENDPSIEDILDAINSDC